MKKIACLAAALCLLVFGVACAETVQGNGFSIALPEGYRVCSEEEIQAYFTDAEADASAELEIDEEPAVDVDHILLAVSETGGSVNIITEDAGEYTAADYVEAAKQVFEMSTGNAVTTDGSGEYGGLQMEHISVSLYGSDITEYFAVENGTAYCITFTNVSAADVDAMLASFSIQ